MRFVVDRSEFDTWMSVAKNLVHDPAQFPGNIFALPSCAYLFVTFDEMKMTLFFSHIRNFVAERGDDHFMYLVTDPDPNSYFGVDSVARYKAIAFDIRDSDAQFLNALNANSGGKEPDCIMDYADQIIVTSGTASWCVFGDARIDLGICAFSVADDADKFRNIYGRDLLQDVAAAANYSFGRDGDSSAAKTFIEAYDKP